MEKSIPVDGSDNLFIITNRIGMFEIGMNDSTKSNGVHHQSCGHMYFDLNEVKNNIKNGIICKHCGNLKNYKKTISTKFGEEHESENESVYIFENGVTTKLNKEQESEYLDKNNDKYFVRSGPSVGLLFCKNGYQPPNGESIMKLNQYPLYGTRDYVFFSYNRDTVDLSKINQMASNFQMYGVKNVEKGFFVDHYTLNRDTLPIYKSRNEIMNILKHLMRKYLNKELKNDFKKYLSDEEDFISLVDFENFDFLGWVFLNQSQLSFEFSRSFIDTTAIYIFTKLFDQNKKYKSMKKYIKDLSRKMLDDPEIQRGLFKLQEFKYMLRSILIMLLYSDNNEERIIQRFIDYLKKLSFIMGSIDEDTKLKNAITEPLKKFSQIKNEFHHDNEKRLVEIRTKIVEFINKNLMDDSELILKINKKLKSKVEENEIDFIKKLDLVGERAFILDYFNKTLVLKQIDIEKFYQNQKSLTLIREINARLKEYVKVLDSDCAFVKSVLLERIYPIPELVTFDISPIESLLENDTFVKGNDFGGINQENILKLLYKSAEFHDVNKILKKYQKKIQKLYDHLYKLRVHLNRCIELLEMNRSVYMYLNPSPMFDVEKHKYFIDNIFPVQFILDSSQNNLVYNRGNHEGLLGNFKIRHIIVKKENFKILTELLRFIQFEKEVYITATENIHLTSRRLTKSISTEKMDSIAKTKREEILKRIQSNQN